MGPSINNLIITLVIGDESHVIVVGNLLYLFITLSDKLSLLLWNNDIIEVERQTSQISHAVTKVLDTIKELTSLGETYILNNGCDDVAQTLLRDYLIYITNLLWNDTVHDNTTNRSLNHVTLCLAVYDIVNHYLYLCVEITLALVVSNDSLLRSVEGKSLTLCTWTDLGDVVQTKYHIL